MASIPAAPLGMIMVMPNGLSRRRPPSWTMASCSMMVRMPPMPVPRVMPMRSRLSSVMARPDWRSASAAATVANC